MGDDLGDEWWTHEGHSDSPEEEETKEKQPTEKTNTQTKPEKRKRLTKKEIRAKKKKSEQKECLIPLKKETEDEKSLKLQKRRKKKKKTITDVLSSSEPKPGCPADLQNLVTQYFSDKLSVIEQEELRLLDSCFLSSNDLTHTLSSYLKQICPKWAKIQKQHSEKSSVVLLIVCSSALRTIELIKQLTTFKGAAKAVKLFAKHIKVEEQVKLLQKGVTHIGVGTPGRISVLIERGFELAGIAILSFGLELEGPEAPRMVDIPEVKLDLMKLLKSGILNGCKEDKIKIGLF